MVSKNAKVINLKKESKLSFDIDETNPEDERLKLRPEDIIRLKEELKEFPDDYNPYGKGYTITKSKFLNDEEPFPQYGNGIFKKWEVVNFGDPDLTPIYFSLPEPPPLELIDGYGLDKDEQYFHRFGLPKKFRQIETKALRDLADIERKNRQDTVQGYKYYLRFWEIVEEEEKNLREEIIWLKKVWWWRTYGYWFYNDGEPVFLPPDYFDFLNFYHIAEAECYPEYRDDVRRKFCFAWYLENCTETFKDLDATGRAKKNIDGQYEMVDLGRRLFFGDVEPKTRRTGATHEAIHKILKGAMSNTSYFSTIISFEGNNAEIHYKKKLLPAFDSYPMCLKPIWEGNRRPTVLRLDAPPNVYHIQGLKSAINFSDSGGLFKNEGDRLNGVLNDEQGKCYGVDTEILMFDGGVKKVQDIHDGEYVMGDDGTPRRVYGSIIGHGDLYEVTSKFGSFVCNGNHILSLKTSMHTLKGGKHIGDVINFPVEEILKWHPQSIRNTKLYRGQIKYKTQNIPLDPYFLGLWLGDGDHGESSISNIDREVIDFILDFVKINNYTYRHSDNNGHHITNKNRETVSCLDILRDMDVYKNKHIPEIYLRNSREVRLLLLAGLIDTDGSRDIRERSRVYDIVQKRKCLAEQICQLANGLGFWSRIENKIATMKRKDGSIYRCDVYRVKIYGDLHLIPVKIKRKQYTNPTWWVNRNPNRSWYKITPIGQGKYYGFAVDGNHLFMLANQIVVHNSSSLKINIFERWHINKFTMSTGMGINILSGVYVKNPSTVEEMESTSAPYYRLCTMSDFYRRVPIKGQTAEGFARIFLPAYLRLEGFIDRFGKSVVDTPTERQIRLSPYAIFATSGKGAREMMQSERDSLLAENTPQSLEAYRSIRRKSPFTWAECWLGASGNVGFNLEIVDKRLGELNKLKSFGRTPYRMGYFRRERGNPDDRVVWVDDPHLPKFKMSMVIPDHLTNQREMIEIWDGLRQIVIPSWRPINGVRFTCGVDPFRNLKATDAKLGSKIGATLSNSRQSDGGIAILWEHDPEIDKGTDKTKWDSFRCVLSYRYRPATQEEYFEDVIMASQYFGAMMYPEQNVERFIEYVFARGYGGYFLYDIDINSGKQKSLPGRYTGTNAQQDMVREIKDYVQNRGHVECHDDLLVEIKNFKGLESFTHNDLLVAFAYALLGSKSRYREIMSMGGGDVIDLSAVFPLRLY